MSAATVNNLEEELGQICVEFFFAGLADALAVTIIYFQHKGFG